MRGISYAGVNDNDISFSEYLFLLPCPLRLLRLESSHPSCNEYTSIALSKLDRFARSSRVEVDASGNRAALAREFRGSATTGDLGRCV